MSNSWLDQVNFATKYPNLGPAKNTLPNADYGRVAALKLASTIFPAQVDAYVLSTKYDDKTKHWFECGKYHFYLLGKDRGLEKNEYTRAELGVAPTYNAYTFPTFDENREIAGPVAHRKVLQDIGEMSRVYGIPFGTLTGAVLTQIHSKISNRSLVDTVAMDGDVREGLVTARGNFGALESLWGMRRAKLPKTFYSNYGGNGSVIASRQTYSKSRRRGRRSRRGFKKRFGRRY